MNKKIKGFTLIELVITIAVVIVLSSISVPVYKDHLSKSKLAEGYALLSTIRSAEETYYAEYGNFYWRSYYESTNNDPILNINARTNKYYTWFYVGAESHYVTNSYCFLARVANPTGTDDGRKYLYLNFNVTTGATYYMAN